MTWGLRKPYQRSTGDLESTETIDPKSSVLLCLTYKIGFPRILWTASLIVLCCVVRLGRTVPLVADISPVDLVSLAVWPLMKTCYQLSDIIVKHRFSFPLLRTCTIVRLTSGDLSLAPSTLYRDRGSCVDSRLVKSRPSDMPSASYGTTFVSGSGAGVDAAGGGEGDLISSSFVVGGVGEICVAGALACAGAFSGVLTGVGGFSDSAECLPARFGSGCFLAWVGDNNSLQA